MILVNTYRLTIILLIISIIISRCAPSMKRLPLIFTYNDTQIRNGRICKLDTNALQLMMYTVVNGRISGRVHFIDYRKGSESYSRVQQSACMNRMYILDYRTNTVRIMKRVRRGYSTGKFYHP
jgi:hypothetical protein